jgi:hypothetical protein
LVMFGSQYLSDEKTWFYSFRKNAWEALDLNPHPLGKKSETYSTIPKMAYDSVNGVMVCLIWLGERGGHETWAFDPGKREWRKLNPVKEPAPSKSRSRNLTFSAELNLFILELSTTNNRPELWTYRYKKASPIQRPLPPANLEALTGPSKAALTWSATATPGTHQYHIYRATPAQPWLADFKKIGATSGASFEDNDVASDRASFYFVKAIASDGSDSGPSFRARTQPCVPSQPIVSVLSASRIEIDWKAHPQSDIVGYNLYRGIVSVKTVKKGEPAAWKDNDPEYAEPQVVKVADITNLKRLNNELLRGTKYADTVDLTKKGPEAADYRFAVYAYVVRAVNKLGIESGPSPYALTIPSEPVSFFCREKGDLAELKWAANPEKGIKGYRVYKLKGTWEIVPATEDLVRETTFTHSGGRNATRYWIVAVDALGQEGQPSSPAWFNHSYSGFYQGDWHQ